MNQIFRILLISYRSLKRARDIYAETFGRKVSDPSITKEIGKLLLSQAGDDLVINNVPAELLLAVKLREGGRTRGSQKPDINVERCLNDTAVYFARIYKQEFIASGMQAGIAEEKAAKKAKAEWQCRISIPTIRRRMSDKPPANFRLAAREWAKLLTDN